MKIKKRFPIFSLIAYAGLVVGAVAFLFSQVIAHAVSTGGHEQEVITPAAKSPGISHVGFTTQSNGNPIAVAGSGGSGVTLNVIDIRANKNILTTVLAADNTDQSVYSWGFTTLSDRTVIISVNTGHLYSFNPDTLVITELSNTSNFDTVANLSDYYWGVTHDENDKIYIASFDKADGGRVLTYDYKTKIWGDLAGRIQSDAQYVRAVAYDNGYIYAGTGAVNPSIYKINTTTRVSTKLDISHHVTPDSSFVFDLTTQNNRIYTSMTGNTMCTTSCIFDATTGAFIDELPTPTGSVYATRPGVNDAIYYRTSNASGTCITEYNAITKTTRNLSCSPDIGDWINRESWITNNLFGSINRATGVVSLYDASTGTITKTDGSLIAISPRDLPTMTEGSDGKLYAGWALLSTTIAQIDPNNTSSYGTRGITNTHPEGLGKSGDWIIYGGYPGGLIGSTHTTTGEQRPAQIIGGEQDRPYAILGIDGTSFAAVGSVPDYGKLGGALTIYDASTNKIDKTYFASSMPLAAGIPSDSLTDLSPMSFAYRNGKLYVGTSIRGGLGVTPTKPSGVLYRFDMATRTVEEVSVPIPSHAAIAALTFSDDGKLYGITGSTVFEVNPDTLATIRTFELGPYFTASGPGAIGYTNGTLFANVSGKIIEINATNFADNRTLADGTAMVLAQSGDLFYTRKSTVYRWVTEDLVDPLISITTPKTGTTADKSLTITATASDNKAVTKVEFYSGTTKIGESTTSPYTFTWNTVAVAEGPHQLTARAYDAAGNMTTSAPISVTISHPVLLVDLAGHKTAYDPIVSAAKVTVKAGDACSDITSSQVLAPTSVTTPTNVTMLGGIGFTLACTAAGGQSEVTVSLGKAYADTTPLRIYKYTDNVLTDITKSVTIQTTNNITTVRYIVKDGATHDDDNVTNGTIVDPLYIGLADPTPTPTDPPATTEPTPTPTPTPDPTAPTENTDGNVLAATGSNTTLLQYIGGGIGLIGVIALVGRIVGRRPNAI